MFIRPACLTLAGLGLLAVPAAAQEVVVEPEAPATAADSAPEPPYPVFYSDLDTQGESTGFAEPWYVREGADEPFDSDPRDSLILPQPQPVVTFGLD